MVFDVPVLMRLSRYAERRAADSARRAGNASGHPASEPPTDSFLATAPPEPGVAATDDDGAGAMSVASGEKGQGRIFSGCPRGKSTVRATQAASSLASSALALGHEAANLWAHCSAAAASVNTPAAAATPPTNPEPALFVEGVDVGAGCGGCRKVRFTSAVTRLGAVGKSCKVPPVLLLPPPPP